MQVRDEVLGGAELLPQGQHAGGRVVPCDVLRRSDRVTVETGVASGQFVHVSSGCFHLGASNRLGGYVSIGVDEHRCAGTLLADGEPGQGIGRIVGVQVDLGDLAIAGEVGEVCSARGDDGARAEPVELPRDVVPGADQQRKMCVRAEPGELLDVVLGGDDGDVG